MNGAGYDGEALKQGQKQKQEQEFLARRFEEHRAHMRAVAYRMLGSLSEADDAVQEAWLRLSRSDTSGVHNLAGWLTTVVGRVCLDMLRSRASRGEESLDVRLPDPIVSSSEGLDPEHEALLADSVGLALLVVLETLAPAERLAFVLHDLFAVPFEEIAPIVGRTPTAARQLASRARRRVQGSGAVQEADQSRQREIVEAFMAASRDGNFEALLTVLDPEVTLRADAGVLPGAGGGAASLVVIGAHKVAGQAVAFQRLAPFAKLVLVNGLPGIATSVDGRPVSVTSFTVRHDRIAEIDILADPDRLGRLDLAFLND